MEGALPIASSSPARDHHPPFTVVGLPTLRIGEEAALREVHHDAF
jgi:hypothetical protein